ncbi:MAG: glucokinase [Alphaproteobacteria bacterium]|nr:glucokinase [Alphaproteobacteria bacterium]
MSLWPALVVDLGGTHVRFGLVDGPEAEPRAVKERLLADGGDFEQAIGDYLRSIGGGIAAASLAVNGPVTADEVTPSNSTWHFSISALKRALGFERLVVVNDFHALALALPRLGPGDVVPVGGGRAQADGARVVLGPGTGFGVAALLRHRGAWVPVASEAGQMSFAPLDEQEARVAAILARSGRVTVERVVCGPGLLEIDRALAEIDGTVSMRTRPEQVAEAAVAGDPRACRALDQFFAALGSVAGDAALAFCATGGVYLAGGVLPKLLGPLAGSRFRARFEDKPPLAALIQAISTSVITRSYPGLVGAAAALGDNKHS